mmetsp:Transcript_22626/g.66462  ORF Transcript_22626/g.66462 Transcript_22626/m.66462 type:complete len:290 (-) Transcript_22626:3122-3991(-)
MASTAGSRPAPNVAVRLPEPGTARGNEMPSRQRLGAAVATSAREVASWTGGCCPRMGSLSSSASAGAPLALTRAVRTAEPIATARISKATSTVCEGASDSVRFVSSSESGAGCDVAGARPSVTVAAVLAGRSGAAVRVTPHEKASPTRPMRGVDADRESGLRTSCSAVPCPNPSPLSDTAYARSSKDPVLSGSVHGTVSSPDGPTRSDGRKSGVVTKLDRTCTPGPVAGGGRPAELRELRAIGMASSMASIGAAAAKAIIGAALSIISGAPPERAPPRRLSPKKPPSIP